MEFIKFCEIGSKSWNQYMEQLEGSSFVYLAENIVFQIEYAKNVIVNESFILIVDKRIIGVACIYIYEDEKKQRNISWGGRYCPAPIVNQQLEYKQQEKYMKVIMKRIDEIATEYQCRSCYLKFEPIANAIHQCKILDYNFLIKYCFLDKSSLTQILDLRVDMDNLYEDVHKGHKRNIKKGEDYQIDFYDCTNVTEEMIELYRDIYEYDAGMVTRNSELYHYYYKFIKNGYGVIGFAKNKKGTIAVLIVTKFKQFAYYSSYAEKTDELEGKSVGHRLHWEMIKYLKKNGIEFYEMGEQVFGEFDKGTEEEKLVNISKFKCGFGGYTMPMFCGKKEYK